VTDLKKDFLKPGKDYRSAPFWSWNDKLCSDELVRQVKDMKEHGMGGFFMHSREGLETEYLTEAHEWTDEYVLWPWGLYEQVRICKFPELL